MREKTIKKKNKRIYFKKKIKDKKNKKNKKNKTINKITKGKKKKNKNKQKGGIDGVQRDSVQRDSVQRDSVQTNTRPENEPKKPKAELEKPPQLESKFINECSELAMECLRLPGVRNSDGVIDKNKCLVELRKKYEKTDNYKSVIKCAFSPYFIDLSAYEDIDFDQIKFQFDNNPVLNEYFDEISDNKTKIPDLNIARDKHKIKELTEKVKKMV